MFLIFGGIGVAAWRDGVLAPYLTINTHCGQFSTTLLPKHLPRRLFRPLLSVVNGGRSIGIVSLVRPCAIGAPEHRAVSSFAHFPYPFYLVSLIFGSFLSPYFHSNTILTFPGSLPLVSSSKYSSNRLFISAGVTGDPPVSKVSRKSVVFTVTFINPERTSCKALRKF